MRWWSLIFGIAPQQGSVPASFWGSYCGMANGRSFDLNIAISFPTTCVSNR
jgi:hypothetical protein